MSNIPQDPFNFPGYCIEIFWRSKQKKKWASEVQHLESPARQIKFVCVCVCMCVCVWQIQTSSAPGCVLRFSDSNSGFSFVEHRQDSFQRTSSSVQLHPLPASQASNSIWIYLHKKSLLFFVVRVSGAKLRTSNIFHLLCQHNRNSHNRWLSSTSRPFILTQLQKLGMFPVSLPNIFVCI